MDDLTFFQQTGADVRFDWGYEGVRTLAALSDIVVIIDVLSFTTCVDVVLNRGGTVFPYPSKGKAAGEYADQVNAIVAGKRGEPISLSPYELSTIPFGSRIVLPSPNGATCSFLARESKATVVAGCFRNVSAVASFARQSEGVVSVIACGERWPDGSLRPAFEDLMAAGAILSQLEEQRLSPEALTAVVVFDANERQASTVAC
ncbi:MULTISPECIES: 2-phosphosulfolactate phosphatase [Brevibacillus]|uniref:2-phosphosulfolactate phosphatase n=1 Tax=Brevibacillus TaxID=55080 RepID=UPI00027199CC|nr:MULTISPECIES: 2-phosphosulfolactate phosphatase [Brevibacillus]EJL40201.1 phosphosulfolactate phosphohydrolase-like enzyme [Brevibacillus sp. CF112]